MDVSGQLHAPGDLPSCDYWTTGSVGPEGGLDALGEENKTGIVSNVTMRRVRPTIIVVEKQ